MNKKFITLSLASFILTGLFLASNTVRADAPTSLLAAGPLTGWAWSDNIGWISLNCSTGGANASSICGTSNYGVTQDSTGNLTGWAWSDNVGWISFTPSVNAAGPTCPSDPADGGNCSARVGIAADNLGQIHGWARAVVGCPYFLWSNTGCAISTIDWPGITSSADGTKLALTGWNNQIYTSNDSGISWTAHAPAFGWHAITMSADGTKLAAGSAYGVMYDSTDSGKTWKQSTTINVWRSVTSSSDGSKLVAGNYFAYGQGSFNTSSNSGTTWTMGSTQPGDASGITSVTSSADGMKVAATTFHNIVLSTDAGITWTVHGPTAPLIWEAITSSADGTKLAAVGYNDHVYVSSDSGATWSAPGPVKGWEAITSSADGTKLAAAAYGEHIYVSHDSGATWTATGPIASWDAITSSADGTKLAAITDNTGEVYVSNDSGATWTAIENQPIATLKASNWDGWIHLSGTNHQTGDLTGAAGVTFSTTTGRYVGSAWGDDVAGWINFNPLGNTGTCDPSVGVCGPVQTASVAQPILYINGGSGAVVATTTSGSSPTATLSWSSINAVSCANQIATNGPGAFGTSAWNGSTNGATSSYSSANVIGPFTSLPSQNPITYTLSCLDKNGLTATSSVTLLISPYGTIYNGLTCGPINNATLCSGDGTSTTTPLQQSKVVNSCNPDLVATPSLCEYTCNPKFRAIGSAACVLPGQIQEK